MQFAHWFEGATGKPFREQLPPVPVPTVVVLDNASIHTSTIVKAARPALRVRRTFLYYLPPYSPELNPAERLFEELRAALASRVFDDLDALDQALTDALRPYWDEPATLHRLTGFPWWLEAVRSITPSVP